MKRYAVFMFEAYYPAGGWNDYKESFDSLEEAKLYAAGRRHPADDSWSYADAHVVDVVTGEIVFEI